MGNTRMGTRLRWARTTLSVVMCSAILSLCAQPAAHGQQGSSASALVAAIAEAQSRVDALDLRMGSLRETVNQALVDLHDAQLRAEQARRGVEEARTRLDRSEKAVAGAREELAEITRSQYRAKGAPSALAGLGGADKAKDVLDRSSFLQRQSEEKQARLSEVERARTEAANEESTLREASRYAEEAASDAAAAEEAARAQLEDSQRELETQMAERQAAEEELRSVQAELEETRPQNTPEPEAETVPAPAVGAGVTPAPRYAAPAAPAEDESIGDDDIDAVREEVETTTPDAPALTDEVISSAISTAQQVAEHAAETSSDPTAQAAGIAAAEALVGSSQAEHTILEDPFASSGSSTGELITAFSRGLSNVLEAHGASTTPAVDSVLPAVGSAETVTEKVASQAPVGAGVETVIARAMAMVGTPYVWGGGDANGPTTGVNGGSLKGFDCSGLVLYAFAGVGISLPHYTGYQYQRGVQIDPSEARRGDLLFWGPNGSQHVAIYLGDGTMIEAPQPGQTVQVAPVRYSGMSEKAVRLL
ncbi:DIP1281 family NlpC/P60 protein [Corynebacterium auris]|uniref:DIP1281 family NlpC/P60 protein n=1 Tax=Corynebacterium auris TaxID=44750 RepID=UPI0025B3B865|nr:NlpC/P60 family protein [Corynebacterium auris]WJY68072.1 Peptidoglycan endopeptidase RipA precursor [Corynebacterium auris]